MKFFQCSTLCLPWCGVQLYHPHQFGDRNAEIWWTAQANKKQINQQQRKQLMASWLHNDNVPSLFTCTKVTHTPLQMQITSHKGIHWVDCRRRSEVKLYFCFIMTAISSFLLGMLKEWEINSSLQCRWCFVWIKVASLLGYSNLSFLWKQAD